MASGEASSTAPLPESAGSAPQRRVVWRNPWVISAVIGVLFMTVMAPLMRHVPEPPAALAPLPRGLGPDGTPVALWSPDHVTLIGFSRSGCTVAEEALFKAHASFEGTAFASQVGPVSARSVVVVDSAEDAPKAIAGVFAHRSPYADWPVFAVLASEVQALRRATPSDDGGCGAGLAGWLTISDRRGEARGLYASSSEEVMSELHHRAQHVYFSDEE